MEIKNKDLIVYLDTLNDLERWNFYSRIRKQNVSSHCFNVAVIVIHFLDHFNIKDTGEIREAVLHDFQEVISSDIPTMLKKHIKRNYPYIWEKIEEDIVKEAELSGIILPSDEKMSPVVKMADLLDSYMFARREVLLGNEYFSRIKDEFVQPLKEVISKVAERYNQCEYSIYEYIKRYFKLNLFREEGKDMLITISHMHCYKED